MLRTHGWRILFLGANTPIATLAQTAASTSPAAVVVTSFDPGRLETEASALRRLGRKTPVLLSGPGASEKLAKRLGLRRLNGDLVAAASEVASGAD